MKKIIYEEGYTVLYEDKPCIIIKIISLKELTIREIYTNIIRTVESKVIDAVPNRFDEIDIVELPQKEFDIALERYNIIKPIVENRNGKKVKVKHLALEHSKSIDQIYRWIRKFKKTGDIVSLANKENRGGKNKSRLTKDQEDIIQSKINTFYLKSVRARKDIETTIDEIKDTCYEQDVKFPHPITIRRRINDLDPEKKARKIYGKKKADELYKPHVGRFPDADYPLAVIQIDHTPVDLLLVDQQERKYLGKPWLTLAMDVYSRMVIGFYLSYDSPSYLSVGMCLMHSILPKEKWLEKINIEADWPSWGKMHKIHVDNGKDFKSYSLKRVCDQYGIELEFRPPGKPHYGGHIERLLGTFMKKIHNLPGSTFSNIQERGTYKSEDNASYTLAEFEQYFTKLVTGVYHQSRHSEIATTPLNKYMKGFTDEDNKVIRQLPDRLTDERKVKIDFLPSFERTIQKDYGVQHENIEYYADCLQPYISSVDNDTNEKAKYTFRWDPRDISKIYFYDPYLKKYLDIPYNNAGLPAMSMWEYHEIKRILKENEIPIDERAIADTYKWLKAQEKEVIRKTKRNRSEAIHKEVEEENVQENFSWKNFNDNDLEPYEEIEFDPFK